MNKKLVQAVFIICSILVMAVPVHAYDVVIDPGHGGDEQNRGGPAFTVSNIGSELSSEVDVDDTYIVVNSTAHFSDTNGYDEISFGENNYVVSLIDRDNNRIYISPFAQSSHPAGASVTVQDFLVQAMGQKDTGDTTSWSSTDGDFDTILYTHQIPANQWDEWQRMEKTDGTEIGLLEFKNNWKIWKELDEALEGSGLDYTSTKESEFADPSFSDRGDSGLEGDLFVSLHTNGGGADYVVSMVWHKNKYKTEWSYQPGQTVNYDGQDRPIVSRGMNMRVDIKPDSQQLISEHVADITETEQEQYENWHIRPWPLRVDADDTDGGAVVEDQFIPLEDVHDVSTNYLDLASKHQHFDTTVPVDAATGEACLKIRGPHQTEYEKMLASELMDTLHDSYSTDSQAPPDTSSIIDNKHKVCSPRVLIIENLPTVCHSQG